VVPRCAFGTPSLQTNARAEASNKESCGGDDTHHHTLFHSIFFVWWLCTFFSCTHHPAPVILHLMEAFDAWMVGDWQAMPLSFEQPLLLSDVVAKGFV
jgi:hypothetical protein